MPSSHPSGGSPTTALRAAAVAVLVLTAVAAGLQVAAALPAMSRPDRVGPAPSLFAPAVLTVLAGVGLAAVVEGVALLAGRPVVAGGTTAVAVADANPGLDRLVAAVDELRSVMADGRAALAEEPLTQPVPHVADGHPTPRVAEPAADPHAEAQPADPYLAHFERMVQLLEEMKELSLLDEAGRQARGQMVKDRKKTARLEEADLLIHRQSWTEADALLTLMESLHPGDGDVLTRRTELDDARSAHLQAEWGQLVRHVEDLMALSRYDEAAAAVEAFRTSYPTHTDAAALADQVTADRDAHLEAGVTALFNEIKTSVEARQWRMALDGAQRFLQRYPDHPRAERIRQQVRTIQKNAEIEERQEQADRIRELAKSGRFAEAADSCEALLSRFPDSPQSPGLRNLLPRLRERSVMAEATAE
jgi:outer membrane protein assembly factor BamD (BamD/ComL family)